MGYTDEWDFVEYIDRLVTQGEAVDVEYKSAAESFPNSIWETYSSFANTNGGVIVLGVREKRGKLLLEGLPSEKIAAYKKIFWNSVNNPDCVSVNLLVDKDVFEGEYDGKKFLSIHVPRAPRSFRPVYCTRTPFRGNTFKRNYEGDYKCTNEEVKHMIADADEQHPRDSRILPSFSLDDIDMDSLRQYRYFFSSRQPGHPWLALDDISLLEKLGGYRKDRETGEEGFTLAGLLMFGKTDSITDVSCAPAYFPDYREYLDVTATDRWSDRICPDGTWEANLFQFYRKVYGKLVSALPKRFRLENDVRQDDSPTHIALREAFVNVLIHCDYTEEGSIVVEHWKHKFLFRNPGTLLVSRAQYYSGGESVCRNKALQKMFMMRASRRKRAVA